MILLDQTMSIIEQFVGELREADDDKRNHLIKSAVSILEISTEALQQSPEFRSAFGMVHAEFLKYPEARAVFERGLKAYKKFQE